MKQNLKKSRCFEQKYDYPSLKMVYNTPKHVAGMS